MNGALTVRAVGPEYSASPLARTHAPPAVAKDAYAKYRRCLRLDFRFRCAYCLAHEREVGPSEDYGGFEVEHFKPKGHRPFRNLANKYLNLLWSCPTCNRAKHHTWPEPAELALGMRFVDPSVEALGDYLQISGDLVVATSVPARAPAAEYMIDVIRLNGGAHQERRRRRKAIAVKLATLEATLEVFREELGDGASQAKLDQISATEKELKTLDDMLGRTPPWDAPLGCHCPPPGAASAPRRAKRSRRKRKKAATKTALRT